MCGESSENLDEIDMLKYVPHIWRFTIKRYHYSFLMLGQIINQMEQLGQCHITNLHLELPPILPIATYLPPYFNSTIAKHLFVETFQKRLPPR